MELSGTALRELASYQSRYSQYGQIGTPGVGRRLCNVSNRRLLPWLILVIDLLFSIVMVIIFVSYQPNPLEQVACNLGDQNSCSDLQQQALGHTLVAIFLGLSAVAGTLLLIWGIAELVWSEQRQPAQLPQPWMPGMPWPPQPSNWPTPPPMAWPTPPSAWPSSPQAQWPAQPPANWPSSSPPPMNWSVPLQPSWPASSPPSPEIPKEPSDTQ